MGAGLAAAEAEDVEAGADAGDAAGAVTGAADGDAGVLALVGDAPALW